MTEENKDYKVFRPLHPRVQQIVEAFAPPSPMVVP